MFELKRVILNKCNGIRKKTQGGFTLIELLAVLVILGILSAIAVPSVMGMIEKSEEEVCEFNMTQVERMYENHLLVEGKKHSEVIFTEFLKDHEEEICENECEFTYRDGEVLCSEHTAQNEADGSKEEDESVPFL